MSGSALSPWARATNPHNTSKVSRWFIMMMMMMMMMTIMMMTAMVMVMVMVFMMRMMTEEML